MRNQNSMRASKKFRVFQSLDDDNIIKSSKGEEDLISELPDDVVGHILCFLPIEDAVRTSILSPDWKYKWMSMSDITIDDKQKSLSGGAKVACFINFVTRVLMRTGTSRIRSFSLSCEQNYPIDYLETWISWVLMRKVQNLKIIAPGIQRLNSQWCFSGWTSLTRLELYLSCSLVLPIDVLFPNLEILCLDGGLLHGSTKIKTEKFPLSGRIILKFPVLKHLILCRCEWVGVDYVEIHAPEMINFETSCVEDVKNYAIKIYGTKLTNFESMHGSINNIDLHAPAITHLDLYHTSFTSKEHQVKKTLLMRTHKILTQSPHLICLKLSGEIVEALVPSSSEYGLVFPSLNEVKEFHLRRCLVGYTLNILRVLPRLESLTLSAYHWTVLQGRGEPWQPLPFSNLNKILVYQFGGYGRDFDFLKFILENATNLNEIIILCCKRLDTTLDAIASGISKIIPKTSTCRILVDYLKPAPR